MTQDELLLELEKEKEMLPSDGAVIAYGIDHFHLSLDDIQTMAANTELSPTSVVEFLIDQEKRDGSADKAVKYLKEYSQEVVEVNQKEKLARYLAISNAGFFDAFHKEIEESAQSQQIKTGFNQLDMVLEGGLHEGLYIIGAIPSLGKTTWVTQMSDHIAKRGKEVLMFSLEMSRFDLMARSISRLTVYKYPGIDGQLITDQKSARGILDGRRYANYTERDRKIIAFAENEYLTFANRIRVFEGTGNVGIPQIRLRVEEHIETMKIPPVVVVDYLQLIAPYDPRASDKQNMDRITLELRRIARDFHCPVLVISSFNRNNYSQKVSYSSFKESGSIEYCADVIIGLQLEGVGESDFDVDQAKRATPRSVEAVILKNRFGQTGETIKYRYYPAVNFFEEVPKEKFK